MREPRNPFRLRAAEYIESDSTFLRLFGPGMLEILPNEDVWDKVHVLRSAPGGGKTSLMRLFTPSCLLALHADRSDDCKDLYQRMRRMGALDDDGPTVLGGKLSCARTYATLADLGLGELRSSRLFFALLNARIVLGALRGALTLNGLRYPDDLDKLQISSPAQVEQPLALNLPCTGRELFGWGRELEAKVCEAIDGFGTETIEAVTGDDGLFALSVIAPGAITVEGKAIAQHVVVLLDDLEKLAASQREALRQAVLETRSLVGVWISERLEVLTTSELLSVGTIRGREFVSVLPLETYWGRKRKQFEAFALNIADRRCRAAADVEISSFASCLQSSLDRPKWQPQLHDATQTVMERVVKLSESSARFNEWIAERQESDGTPHQRAIGWRALEILIEREKRRTQLMFDWALSPEELDDKDDSAVRAAGELFLATEFALPYYFGPARLAAIASSNVEQFLWLAGDQFEEIISSLLIKRGGDLAAERQEAVLKKAIDQAWRDIPLRMRNGQEVKRFLEAVGTFCNKITFQPNGPYAPGVTGIAIAMSEAERLRDGTYAQQSPEHADLANVIATALAYNLLEAIQDYKCKGQVWMVLNLNRMLCVKFGLPLQYGGWRDRSLRELSGWVRQGFRSSQEQLL